MEKPPKILSSLVVIPETMDDSSKSPALSVPSPSDLSKWPSLRGLVYDWQEMTRPAAADENSQSFDDFDWSVNYLKEKSACLTRFLYSDQDKFRNIKLLFILLVSILYGLLGILILHFSFSSEFWISGIVGLLVTIVVFLLLIFCYASRCILSLVVPSLSTKQGKTILIALLVTQLMSGPLGNLTYNLEQSSHSLSCFSNMTVNQTQEIKQAIKISLNNFTQNFSTHPLKQAEEVREAVATVAQEWYSTFCGTFLSFFGSCPSVQTEIKKDFKNTIGVPQIQDQIASTNKTLQHGRHQMNKTLRNVKEDVVRHFKKFYNFEFLLKVAAIFSFLYLLFSCWLYYYRFLHILSYDNVYATELLKRYDLHCSERGSTKLFPLRPRENLKIINSVSLSMSPFERKAFFISLVLYMVQCIVALALYVADWTLYSFMEIIIRNVNQSDSTYWNETITYRLDSINFELNIPFNFDAKKCLVFPRKVSTNSVILLVIVYVILGLAVLSQAYCLRFRHAITAYFYPERNSERVQYLYNKLLRKREKSKLNLKFLFPFRKVNSVRTITIVPEPAAEVSLKQRFLIVMRKLGIFRRYCLVCGFPENSEFKKCYNFSSCSSIYCASCFDDINNVCLVCHD